MLKVSIKTIYALRALLDLVSSSLSQPERLSKIAERQNIPLPFLEQIFSKLKKAGLVIAVRGPFGGYQLGSAASGITLGDIVTALEGPMEPVLCSQPQNRSERCHDVEGCLSRLLCNELDGAVLDVLKKNTLANLAGEAIRLQPAVPPGTPPY